MSLKSFFDAARVRALGASLAAVHPAFPTAAFVADATDGLDALELLDRGRHIARALHRHLPADYAAAVDILVRSAGPPLPGMEGQGMAPFFYLPHTVFIAEHGLVDIPTSLLAQEVLTQRFSCEFSIRVFLDQAWEQTLPQLQGWAQDPRPLVRRLVSEGSRPRLPWASRLRVREPAAIEALLHQLVDDPSPDVRRSVANHIGDIGKDEPDRAVAICAGWLRQRPDRAPLVRHGLRDLIKKAHPGALSLLGGGEAPAVRVSARLPAETLPIGGKLAVEVSVVAEAPAQSLVVDLVVFFIKARGAAAAKVFKLGAAVLSAEGDRATFRKTISLAQHSTRTHFPGRHEIAVQVNGVRYPVGAVELVALTRQQD